MTAPPDPRPARPRPSRAPIRWTEVALGFAVGVAVAWGPRLVLLWIFGAAGADDLMWVALLLPTVLLVAAIYWAARTRRKGLAVGMALYAATAALLLGGLALFIVAVCGGSL